MDMDMSMDIHVKSVDMDMDAKFHIHGKPAVFSSTFMLSGLSRGLAPLNNQARVARLPPQPDPPVFSLNFAKIFGLRNPELWSSTLAEND